MIFHTHLHFATIVLFSASSLKNIDHLGKMQYPFSNALKKYSLRPRRRLHSFWNHSETLCKCIIACCHPYAVIDRLCHVRLSFHIDFHFFFDKSLTYKVPIHDFDLSILEIQILLVCSCTFLPISANF